MWPGTVHDLLDFCENHIRSCNFNVQKKKEEEKQTHSEPRFSPRFSLYGNYNSVVLRFLKRRNWEMEVGRAVIIKKSSLNALKYIADTRSGFQRVTWIKKMMNGCYSCSAGGARILIWHPCFSREVNVELDNWEGNASLSTFRYFNQDRETAIFLLLVRNYISLMLAGVPTMARASDAIAIMVD